MFADSLEDAFEVFEVSNLRVTELFSSLYGYEARTLNLIERLELLYDIHHPETDAPEFGSRVDYDGRGFSIASTQRMMTSTKEVHCFGTL